MRSLAAPARWLNPVCFDRAWQTRMAAAFAASPTGTLVIDDLLVPDRLEGLRRLFRREQNWAPQYGLYRHPHEVGETEFHAAPDQQRFFHYLELRKTAPDEASFHSYLDNAVWCSLLDGADFKNWLSRLTGTKLGPIEGCFPRVMRHDHYLRPHNDSANHRALCLVYYLAETWQQTYGGAFEMADKDHAMLFNLDPKPNRLLIFEPRRTVSHYVTPFTAALGETGRWSYSIWYRSGAQA